MSRAGTWTIRVLLGVLGLCVAMAFWPWQTSGFGISSTTICYANLRNLALAIDMYRQGNDDVWPDSLATVWEYIPSQDLFVCPEDERPFLAGPALPCSYHYVGRLAPATDPWVIIAYENAGNHRAFVPGPDKQVPVRHVIYFGLDVERIAEWQFSGRLSASLAVLKEHWDQYPPARQEQIEAFYADMGRKPEE